MSLLRLTDLTNPARRATLAAADVAPVIGQWLAADGARDINDTGALSPNVAHLARALRNGNWTRVHALADHLAMDIEVLLP